jgi:hypothetical protein
MGITAFRCPGHRNALTWALGPKAIEATVEIWQVDGSLPWEQLAQAPSHRRAGNRQELCLAAILGWLSGLLHPADRATVSQPAGYRYRRRQFIVEWDFQNRGKGRNGNAGSIVLSDSSLLRGTHVARLSDWRILWHTDSSGQLKVQPGCLHGQSGAFSVFLQ